MKSVAKLRHGPSRLKTRLTVFAIALASSTAANAAPVPKSYPSGNVHIAIADAKWEPLIPAGEKAILQRSADGKDMSGLFRPVGSYKDVAFVAFEFAHILKGSVKVDIHGGEKFTVKAGDFVYLVPGTVADFEFSPGFEELIHVVSEKVIPLD